MLNRLLPILPETKENFRRFAEQLTGFTVVDSHIKKIKVHSFSDRIRRIIDSDICIGQEIDSNISNSPHEPVLGIFEARLDAKNEYIVVTPDKNNQRGTLYFFEPEEVTGIEKEG